MSPPRRRGAKAPAESDDSEVVMITAASSASEEEVEKPPPRRKARLATPPLGRSCESASETGASKPVAGAAKEAGGGKKSEGEKREKKKVKCHRKNLTSTPRAPERHDANVLKEPISWQNKLNQGIQLKESGQQKVMHKNLKNSVTNVFKRIS
ncbi:uncharacterized protein [Bactrocera oleae]|uniref:uncharacterized protein n=1 Tax=Bactrocera oleae TaxID=104688 RepID=UPI00387E4457